MSRTLDLTGHAAYVTGATRGIGWACARTLAAAGANIAICSRAAAEEVSAAAHELAKDFNVEALGLSCDVSDASAVKKAFQAVQKQFGRLDVFVNNAGVMDTALLPMSSAQSIEQTTQINVNGALFNLQMAARLMARKQSGSIINLSSIVGRYGSEGQVAYSASKAAVIGMSLAAAKELASQNIRVNAIAPGFIDTELLKDFDAEARAKVIANIKMGRMGTAEEVADSVLFLASDLAAYVTGQVLGVDGGMVV